MWLKKLVILMFLSVCMLYLLKGLLFNVILSVLMCWLVVSGVISGCWLISLILM